MKIDNFDLIRSILKFESNDDFYFFTDHTTLKG